MKSFLASHFLHVDLIFRLWRHLCSETTWKLLHCCHPFRLHDWASQLLGDHPSHRSQQDVGAPTRSLRVAPDCLQKCLDESLVGWVGSDPADLYVQTGYLQNCLALSALSFQVGSRHDLLQ